MATPAQITANQINAQHSTGPRSVEGKDNSSRNSLKLGIYAKAAVIPGENPDELEELERSYRREFEPKGAVENTLIEIIVRSAWLMRRLSRIEAQVMRAHYDKIERPTPRTLGEIYIDDFASGKVFESLARRQASVQREYFRAIKELRLLQYSRNEAEQPQALAARPLPENRLRSSNPENARPAGPQPTPGPRPPVPGPASAASLALRL